MSIAVVSTGTANTASVLAGLVRAGAVPEMTVDPEVVRTADRLVLPGVGAFAAAMRQLGDDGLVEALRERVREGRPTLGVCLGLQLLALTSEESPGVAGLGVVDAVVERFPEELVVPQMGWNRVVAGAGCRYLDDGWAYFANSYRVKQVPPGWSAAMSDYGGPFVAAFERGDVLACQFHPELSGDWGQRLLSRFLDGVSLEGVRTPPKGNLEALVGGEPAMGSGHPEKEIQPPRSLGRRVIPCLDVRDGRVVKGVQFQGLRDAGDPASLAGAYAAQAADEIVVLDVSATPEGRGNRLDTVRAVRAELTVPLTVGGGVRTVADAAALLGAGADKVAVNTAAVRNPELLTELAERFGRQCIVLAIDAARTESGWEVVVYSGENRTGLDAVEWARRGAELGAGEILLTSWDRDGTRQGYDTELLAAVSEAVRIPIIASGGADNVEHLAMGLDAGASAVLAASIFHFGDTTPATLKRQLQERGVEVRP